MAVRGNSPLRGLGLGADHVHMTIQLTRQATKPLFGEKKGVQPPTTTLIRARHTKESSHGIPNNLITS